MLKKDVFFYATIALLANIIPYQPRLTPRAKPQLQLTETYLSSLNTTLLAQSTLLTEPVATTGRLDAEAPTPYWSEGIDLDWALCILALSLYLLIGALSLPRTRWVTIWYWVAQALVQSAHERFSTLMTVASVLEILLSSHLPSFKALQVRMAELERSNDWLIRQCDELEDRNESIKRAQAAQEERLQNANSRQLAQMEAMEAAYRGRLADIERLGKANTDHLAHVEGLRATSQDQAAKIEHLQTVQRGQLMQAENLQSTSQDRLAQVERLTTANSEQLQLTRHLETVGQAQASQIAGQNATNSQQAAEICRLKDQLAQMKTLEAASEAQARQISSQKATNMEQAAEIRRLQGELASQPSLDSQERLESRSQVGTRPQPESQAISDTTAAPVHSVAGSGIFNISPVNITSNPGFSRLPDISFSQSPAPFRGFAAPSSQPAPAIASCTSPGWQVISPRIIRGQAEGSQDAQPQRVEMRTTFAPATHEEQQAGGMGAAEPTAATRATDPAHSGQRGANLEIKPSEGSSAAEPAPAAPATDPALDQRGAHLEIKAEETGEEGRIGARRNQAAEKKENMEEEEAKEREQEKKGAKRERRQEKRENMDEETKERERERKRLRNAGWRKKKAEKRREKE